MGYGRLKKMVQGKETMNKNQSLLCQRCWHDLLFFLHQFMRLVLLLMLYNIGKIFIHHYHLFLLIHILHLVLFKSLHLQGELIISGDSRVVFWWATDGNHRLSFLKNSYLSFVRNGLFAIYFWPIFVGQFWKVVLLVLQQCVNDCIIIGGRWKLF